jgi:hypothetical protein
MLGHAFPPSRALRKAHAAANLAHLRSRPRISRAKMRQRGNVDIVISAAVYGVRPGSAGFRRSRVNVPICMIGSLLRAIGGVTAPR